MKNTEIIPLNDENAGNEFIKYPGDKMTKIMTPCGNIVTRLDTKERKATHRQYMKKDGTPGKQTITIMQLDK